MTRLEAPRWKRHSRRAAVIRLVAFALPVLAGAAAAVAVLLLFSGWTDAWRVVWWTCAIAASVLAAIACLPLARRLSVFGLLLGFDTEFPTDPPARLASAWRASTVEDLELELVASAHPAPTEELVTDRMATAASLGVLRVLRVRGGEAPRIVTTLAVATVVALGALVVLPDRAEPPTNLIAAGPGPGGASVIDGTPSSTEAPTTVPASPSLRPPRTGTGVAADAVPPPSVATQPELVSAPPASQETGSAVVVVATAPAPSPSTARDPLPGPTAADSSVPPPAGDGGVAIAGGDAVAPPPPAPVPAPDQTPPVDQTPPPVPAPDQTPPVDQTPPPDQAPPPDQTPPPDQAPPPEAPPDVIPAGSGNGAPSPSTPPPAVPPVTPDDPSPENPPAAADGGEPASPPAPAHDSLPGTASGSAGATPPPTPTAP